MKTFKIISTVLIVIFSFSAFAKEKKANCKMNKAKLMNSVSISAPAFEWGNPSDVDNENLKNLKTSPYILFEAPAMIWGNPEELNLETVENLKNALLVSAPEMVWGNPNDVYYFEISK